MPIKKSDIFLPPNILTLLRLILLPFVFYFLFKETRGDLIIAIILMAIIFFSDVFDGYLARKLNQVSDFGKVLDPVVDKIVIFCFCLYVIFYKGFPVWAFVLIFLKDITALLGAFYLIKAKKTIPSPNRWGKYSVFVLGIALFLYIIELDFWKTVALEMGIVLVVITMFTYARSFIRTVRRK